MSAPSDRLRVGLVGAGAHAHRNVLPTAAMLPFDLVAVADPVEERARTTARRHGASRSYSSAAQMYRDADIDAVLLCVSPQLHPKLAIAAFEAGLDVWSEKPAAASSAQVRDMLAARGDRVCVVGYKKAFMPAARKARELLARRDVGDLVSASGAYPVELPPPGGAPPFPIGSWLTSGCHPLSLLISIAGPVRSVTSHRATGGGGVVVLEHEGGRVSALHASLGAPKHQPCEHYRFVTQGQSIEIVNSRRLVFQRGFDVDYDADDNFAPAGIDGGAIVWEAQDTMATLQGKNAVTQGIYGGLATFFESVAERRPPTIGSLEFALAVTDVYEAAQVSAGSPVPIASD